ncbi:beta-lactamase family protein [Dyadobacter sp. CY261]|uniref:serine hydrolase domain-containing protein n=1 Tax=Dyadobacter sp. CY261 TaxID=2907203 RepID=UPI001F2978E3|nr:serine hydrolase domain-containing protein [Dyadobacter sp. CY261]MCF0075566.1 beta-lactamase family protein [Dyadobacter sp. CY261]
MTTKFRAIFMAAGLLLLISTLTSCEINPGKTKPEKIDYVLEKAFKKREFVGNAIVLDKGNVIYKKSYGEANVKAAMPNSDSTKFLIASLSKPFTAILILKLAKQGKLDLNDGIEKFFPEVPELRDKKITIHHLLTHTSGIKEFITEKHVFEQNDLNGTVCNFDPGSDFEYSNSGYVLLKEIAEISSGKSYKELVNTIILSPLNMNSSGVARDMASISNLAVGYKDASQQEVDEIAYSLGTIDGAGSLFSTATDMVKFSQGIDSQDFLPKSLQALMFRQHVNQKCGYGWFLRERGGVWDVSYHKGDLPGYTSFLSRRTTGNQMILLLSNASRLDLADLENEIAKILKGTE